MREYADLPASISATVAAAPATPVALIALHDGRVEPVWAYWREGDRLAYVALGDQVRSVPLTSVDLERSQKLNRQQGVEIHLAPPR